MAFTLKVEHQVLLPEALAAADDIERAVGEICNGKRKAGSIPMQSMCSLVQFVRDEAAKANQHHNGPRDELAADASSR